MRSIPCSSNQRQVAEPIQPVGPVIKAVFIVRQPNGVENKQRSAEVQTSGQLQAITVRVALGRCPVSEGLLTLL